MSKIPSAFTKSPHARHDLADLQIVDFSNEESENAMSEWYSGHVHIDADYSGTSGRDRLIGTDDRDAFDIEQGGNDTVKALGGDDFIDAGAAFTRDDRVNGGAGFNQLSLAGAYTDLFLLKNSIINIQYFNIDSSSAFHLILNDRNIKAGDGLTITAASPSHVQSVIDASHETDGSLVVYQDSGDGRYIGGSSNDAFYLSGTGEVIIDGGAGVDRVGVFDFSSGIELDLRRQGETQAVGQGQVILTNIEALRGTTYDDVLIGDNRDNFLWGFGGNDKMAGHGGDDVIQVHVGSDQKLPTDISVDGGSGFDVLSFFDPTNTYSHSVEFDLSVSSPQDSGQGVVAFRRIEGLQGTVLDDSLSGNDLANKLFGNDGDDQLHGVDGDDFLFGDAYIGSTEVQHDFYIAAGNDVLDGGGGHDVMTGGGGSDTFFFGAIADSTVRNADLITDFSSGDRLDLHAIDANSNVGGDQAFHLGATAAHAGDIVLHFDPATGQTQVRLFVDGDAHADAMICLMGDHTNLTMSDFVL